MILLMVRMKTNKGIIGIMLTLTRWWTTPDIHTKSSSTQDQTEIHDAFLHS